MALIDVVKWYAAGDELMWEFPNSELSTMTQLIVHERQWAMLYKDGQRLDTFGAGRHTLTTTIPIFAERVLRSRPGELGDALEEEELEGALRASMRRE